MISCYAWFNLAVTIPPTPEQTPGQVQPFGPASEKLFEAVLSRGYKEGEANQYLFFDFAKYVQVRVISRAVCTNGCGLHDYVF